MPNSVNDLHASDADFGITCPECAAPKTARSHLCRACYKEKVQRLDKVTCMCGRRKSRHGTRCIRCEAEARTGFHSFRRQDA